MFSGVFRVVLSQIICWAQIESVDAQKECWSCGVVLMDAAIIGTPLSLRGFAQGRKAEIRRETLARLEWIWLVWIRGESCHVIKSRLSC